LLELCKKHTFNLNGRWFYILDEQFKETIIKISTFQHVKKKRKEKKKN